MSADMPVFPKGSIALDNGDLVQVKNVKVDQEKVGTQMEHTLRQEAAGIFIGNEETKLSWEFVTPEGGAERDYYKMLRTGRIKTVRVKVPGETFAVKGVLTKRSMELPFDSAIKQTIEFLGKTEK
jgi:hypothetical protein